MLKKGPSWISNSEPHLNVPIFWEQFCHFILDIILKVPWVPFSYIVGLQSPVICSASQLSTHIMCYSVLLSQCTCRGAGMLKTLVGQSYGVALGLVCPPLPLIYLPKSWSSQGGLYNGALTQQFAEWKLQHLGGTTWDPNYNPGVDFLDHDFL